MRLMAAPRGMPAGIAEHQPEHAVAAQHAADLAEAATSAAT